MAASTSLRIVVISIAMFLTNAASSRAQQDSGVDVSKQLENPVASVIVIPIQNTIDLDADSHHHTWDAIRIQPIIPVHLTKTGCSSRGFW